MTFSCNPKVKNNENFPICGGAGGTLKTHWTPKRTIICRTWNIECGASLATINMNFTKILPLLNIDPYVKIWIWNLFYVFL